MGRHFEILPGKPYPLGATWDGAGVNFALFSAEATEIVLCLFDAPLGELETEQVALTKGIGDIWHVYLAGIGPGQLYGYRANGDFAPERGLRFNSHKLLVDPYARALAGSLDLASAMFGYPLDGGPDRDLIRDEQNSGPDCPKGIVIDNRFDWGDDRPPRRPWHETVIYEAHVRGLTILNEALPEAIRGTYAGLADERVIAYLRDLGVTALEVLPIHQFLNDRHHFEIGLPNYWGYATLGFFAPHWRYSSSGMLGEQVTEFKSMVRTLHRAGIEVILDVVFNHTAEGHHAGPTLAFRGLDNRAYYRLEPHYPRLYRDYTGTGSTFNTARPRVLQLIMDSLRYWVQEMHVDGFRFDLATTLARGDDQQFGHNSFFDLVLQDPIVSQVKLIAEPWDVGPGGYQLGHFPPAWSEWNDKYRDTLRRFWRGDSGQIGDLGFRLTGSSDVFAHNGRGPAASVNFITAHDGFTLRDLVSYNHKHNEANREGGRDGNDYNYSYNHGAEGATDDPEIRSLRLKQIRNFLASLFISQGVPMLLQGDEIGRSQGGNNNAFCQDNEVSWQPWRLDDEARGLLAWTQRLIALRREHSVFRQQSFFDPRAPHSAQGRDIHWLQPGGEELGSAEWEDDSLQAFALWIAGDSAREVDAQGQPIVDVDALVLFNASDRQVEFNLPATAAGWYFVLDTDRPDAEPTMIAQGDQFLLAPKALALLLQAVEQVADCHE